MTKISQLPRYTFGWNGALALFLGLFVSQFVLGGIAVASKLFTDVDVLNSGFIALASYIVSFAGAIYAFDVLVCRKQTHLPLNFNFSGTDLSTYFLIFVMMFGMMLISEFFTSLLPVTGPFWGDFYEYFEELMNSMMSDKYVMIVTTSICAPILEEIVFRGIIQKGLINKGVRPLNAIFYSALVFGLVHGNPWQFVGAVMLGMVLGLVYYKTGSLLLSILLHAFNNFTSVVLILYVNTESFSDAFCLNKWLLLLIGIVIFSVSYYFFVKKYPKPLRAGL